MRRPLNALIANLAFVSIISAGLGAVYISGLDVVLQNLWICSVFSYFRSEYQIMSYVKVKKNDESDKTNHVANDW